MVKPNIEINGKTLDWNEMDGFPVADDFEKSTIDFLKAWKSETPFFDLFTSGSTGTPKAITVSREQMVTSAAYTIKALNIKKESLALVCLNTAFIAGKMMLVRALINHMPIKAITPSSNPLQDINEPIEFTAIVPLQLETILNDPISLEKLSSVKKIIVGGAPVSNSLRMRIQELDTAIYGTYGMTETVSHIALKRLNGHQPEDYYQAFEEVLLGKDERNCLTIQSKLSNDVKIVTNDIVELKGNNQFKWLGRADNVINTGGIKVQSEVIENKVADIIRGLDLNCRFFITALPDERLGQTVALILESTPPAATKTDELSKALKSHLSKYETPRSIHFVSKFEETPTAKINRKATVNKLQK